MMARQVLRALTATPAIDQVLTVTASDEVAQAIQPLGGLIIRQPADCGTRSAFAYALSTLRSLEPSARPGRVLMIAGDIPMVTSEALTELLERCHASRGVAVVPDQHRMGTNALLCSPPDVIAPCFGADSLRRHVAAAQAVGLQPQVLESRALSLDIDVHEDLTLLSKRLGIEGGTLGDPRLRVWMARHFSVPRTRLEGMLIDADLA